MGCGGKESTSGRNGAARRHLRRTRKKACRDWCRAVTPKPQNDDKPRPLSRHVASSVLNRNEMPVASHYRPGREWIAVLFSRPTDLSRLGLMGAVGFGESLAKPLAG